MLSNQMKLISKHKLEISLSEIGSRKFFSYGKKRVSGTSPNTYFMHSRSACMPGQSNLFASDPNSNPKDKTEIICLWLERSIKGQVF